MNEEKLRDKKFLMLTEEPFGTVIAKMAPPTVISALVTSFYSMANTYFVSHLGKSATAAIGVVFSLQMIVQAVGFFFGQGCGNYVSRELGARHFDNASKMISLGFFSSMAAGILFAAAGLLFAEPLSIFLGATETILPYAKDYLSIILLGAPFMCSQIVVNNLMRNQGSPLISAIGMVSGNIVSLILSPLFIFYFDMGIRGAAYATVTSQAISCTILIIMSGRGGNIRPSLKNFRPQLFMYREMVKSGLPALGRQAMASVASILLNRGAAPFGDSVIAAMAIVQRVTMMVQSAFMGFGQSYQPLCGFSFGAGKYERVKEGFYYYIKIGAIILGTLALGGFIFAEGVIAIFSAEDAEVLSVGSRAFRYQCVTLPLLSWTMLTNQMLQAIGRPIEATFLSIARQGLFLIILRMILTPIFGVPGLILCQPISDFITFCVSAPIGRSIQKRLGKDIISSGDRRRREEETAATMAK